MNEAIKFVYLPIKVKKTQINTKLHITADT